MCAAIEYTAAKPVSLLHLLHLKLPNDSSAVNGTTNQRQPCASNLARCSMNAWVLSIKGALSQICKGILPPRVCSIARPVPMESEKSIIVAETSFSAYCLYVSHSWRA